MLPLRCLLEVQKWGAVSDLRFALRTEGAARSMVAPGNFSIEVTSIAAQSLAAAMNMAIRALMALGAITHDGVLRPAESCVWGRLSMFRRCLPEELELKFLALRVMEFPMRAQTQATNRTQAPGHGLQVNGYH